MLRPTARLLARVPFAGRLASLIRLAREASATRTEVAGGAEPSDTEIAKLRNQARHEPDFWIRAAPWARILLATQDAVERGSTNPHYAKAYRAEETSYWLHLARWMYEDAQTMTFRRVLDVGPGYGTLALYLHELSGCDVRLVDTLDVYLSRALADRPRFEFRVSNVETEPLPFAGPFDAVIFSEVVEHLNFHPVPTLRKLAEAMAPAGRMYLSTPDAAFWGRVTKYYDSLAEIPLPGNGSTWIDDHIWQYSESELRDVISAAGLAVERCDRAPGRNGNAHLNLVCRRADQSSRDSTSL